MAHEGDGDTNCNWCTRHNLQKTGKGIGRFGNERTNGDHPNYSIIKITENNKKSP